MMPSNLRTNESNSDFDVICAAICQVRFLTTFMLFMLEENIEKFLFCYLVLNGFSLM